MVDNNKQEMNHAVPEECSVHDSYKTSTEQDKKTKNNINEHYSKQENSETNIRRV
jgi:hypothetical protein